ncbi:hypothetical protein LCGC14_1503910 [marine sediment metagenome]|uniref:Uncharacterized protein n=1 Tax=marine sediment metagenome TaxID=412755 RepID=A0A0F9LIN2_9ZZZZ
MPVLKKHYYYSLIFTKINRPDVEEEFCKIFQD